MAKAPKGAATPDTLSDPVDWAKHYWEDQTFDGDEQRFLALTSLLRYQRTVTITVDTELKHHSLNTTDYLLLMALQLSENGTRLISSLARNLVVHATTATLATDRLEQRAMLKRSPHPTDRRAICVTITDLGRKTVDDATRALTIVEFGMPGSTAKDVARLRAAVTAMRRSAGEA